MSDPRFPIGKFTPPAVMTDELRAECVGQIAAAPAAVRAAIRGLTPVQLETPYREGGWTVAQVVHHLPDSHMNAYIRFKLALTEDSPTIKPYKEDLWARLPDGSAADVAVSLDLLEALHRRWVASLARFGSDEGRRTMVHPERGPQTLDRTLALYAWHGRHHTAHITALRERMGW
jgi:uncharacterized damage-inducible protein DinB